jgi:NAD(P)-dependent dehydrogenase (short-subunit alcohol dehydrogenase family)
MAEPGIAKQRVAVVTGGAGGIGGAIMAALVASGHAVVSLDQAGDSPVDLGREEEVRAAAGSVLEEYGRCDVLVHAAALTGQTLCTDGGLILRLGPRRGPRGAADLQGRG